jgi:flagellar basal body-associated protein FliL
MIDINATHQAAQIAVQQADSLSTGAITLVTILLALVLVMGVGFIYTMLSVSKHFIQAAKAEFASLRDEVKNIVTELKQLNDKHADHNTRLTVVEKEMGRIERRKDAC